MPKDLLSDAKIRTAKPDAKPYKLSDGGGLFLLIQPSGSKLWRWKFRLNGKETTATSAACKAACLLARSKRQVLGSNVQ